MLLPMLMKKWLLEWFIEGSDPGLCVTDHVPDEIVAFGKRCKVDLIEQSEARELAAKHDIYLEGLGGTNQGIIGDGNQHPITNSFNAGVHGAELAKLLDALRTAFEAEKQSLSPQEARTVERCLNTIEEEAKEKEPSGSVIKSMGEKLFKGIETSAKAVGVVEAAKKLWDFCQQWGTGG